MPPQTKKTAAVKKTIARSAVTPLDRIKNSSSRRSFNSLSSNTLSDVVDSTDDSTTIHSRDGLDNASASEPNSPAPDSIDVDSQDEDNGEPELDHDAELGELFLHIF